jgi:site-specific recombinase XerD
MPPPLTRQAVNYLVEQIGKRAKLGFKVTPHMLRHSTGYYLANKGCDTRLIQDYLGHRNITHTVRSTLHQCYTLSFQPAPFNFPSRILNNL